MSYRRQFCPVCQVQTKHKYTSVSLVMLAVTLLCGVLPGFVYLWVTFRRADRTATCTVDHRGTQNAQLVDLILTLEAARNGGASVAAVASVDKFASLDAHARATAANQKQYRFPKWLF